MTGLELSHETLLKLEKRIKQSGTFDGNNYILDFDDLRFYYTEDEILKKIIIKSIIVKQRIDTDRFKTLYLAHFNKDKIIGQTDWLEPKKELLDYLVKPEAENDAAQ